jgi:hypothetical protein
MVRELKMYFAYTRIRDNWNAFRKENPMLSVSQILKSRTVWTLVLAALFNGWNSISGQVQNPHVVNVINGIFAMITLYFRISPNQHVEAPSSGTGTKALGIVALALLFGLTPLQAQTPPDPAPVWQPQYFVGTGITYDYYGPTGFAANTEFAALLKGNTYSYSTLELTRAQATVRTGAAYMFYNANHWSLFGLVDGGIATGTGPTLGSFSGGGFGGYDLGGKLTKDITHLFIGAGVRLINTSGQTTQPIFGFIIGKAF